MKLNSIELKNYRNTDKLFIEPESGVNVIYGENAQGKTNLLEAVWMISGLKSFRGAKDRETVKFGCDFSKIKAEFETSQRVNKTEITITNKKKVVYNGVELLSATELAGKFATVVFSPCFLSIVKDGPGERRKFADTAICRLKPAYIPALTRYTKLLQQRNSLLKDVVYNAQLLDLLYVIDEKISEAGKEVTAFRNDYISVLTPFVKEIYFGLSSGKEEISLEYKSSIPNDSSFTEVLKSSRKEDILSKTTSFGPHRDDIEIKINGISARVYGSQGQQRSCALALKLGEASVIKEKTGEKPVALLDDVMSELDLSRQDYILNHIKDWQVFITCCDPAPVLRMCSGKAFNIKEGKIIKCT